MHFLPHLVFMGSNKFINPKVFCEWEGPPQVYIMFGRNLGFHYDPETKEPGVPPWGNKG